MKEEKTPCMQHKNDHMARMKNNMMCPTEPHLWQYNEKVKLQYNLIPCILENKMQRRSKVLNPIN
jgi:hypothetical protein